MFNILLNLLSKRRRRYQQVFETPAGKWVLADLAARFRAMAPTYVPNDPHAGAYREGQRNVLLFIFEQLLLTEVDVFAMVDAHSRSGEYLE